MTTWRLRATPAIDAIDLDSDEEAPPRKWRRLAGVDIDGDDGDRLITTGATIVTASGRHDVEQIPEVSKLLSPSDALLSAGNEGSERAIVALFVARGLGAGLAQRVVGACMSRRLPRSAMRNLVAALGRSPLLVQRLIAGEMSPETFADMPIEALATSEQQERRKQEAAAAQRAIVLDDRAETFALVCEECGAKDALGSWIMSTSGGKPMLGSARMVKRGSCVSCGHIWLDEGR